jgi:transmembrane E3 ubiquitin-protein ligase
VIVLLLQYYLGPRFFVPGSMNFFSQKYDYKRDIPIENFEDGEVSCVICMASIEKEDDVYQNYMVAPCNHVFHDICIQRWMEEKMECPTCRSLLPEY